MKINFLPPTLFTALLLLLIGSHLYLPIKDIIGPPYSYIGWILIIFGIILNLWADQLFKRSKTTVKPYEKPTKLETSGPFRISRHPMYLGMGSILLGTAIVLGSVSCFIFVVVFAIIAEIFYIYEEEKNMISQFEDEYHKYRRKVRRWI